ncbi:MAG: prepilin-type N-terminal cleavage/methylation domain-containing protein [Planctomycetota bacterium]|jgi:prepilin-type N-terminal cleavage/methylation domain-containing protein
MKNRERPGGFTLVEVMIAVGIFSVIAIAVSLLYQSGTKAYRQSVIMAQMRMQCQRTIFEITRDLVDCQIIDGANLLDRINFQKPTARRNTFGELRLIDTSTNQPFWGDGETEDDGGATTHVGNTVRIRFISNAIWSEAADNVDYNRDGDMTDVYERGRIVREVFAAGSPPPAAPVRTRNLTGNWVFVPQLPHATPPELGPMELQGIDIDNLDGNMDDPDPIFLLLDDAGAPDAAGGRIQVRIFNMAILNRIPVLVCYETVVTPVNK